MNSILVFLIAVVVLILIALIVIWGVTRGVAKTAAQILVILDKSRRPLNVSELCKETNRNSGFVTNALELLFKRGDIAVQGHISSRWEMVTDASRYFISPKGRETLHRRS